MVWVRAFSQSHRYHNSYSRLSLLPSVFQSDFLYRTVCRIVTDLV